jgi:F-type H+-transporting ATPase subunit delta
MKVNRKVKRTARRLYRACLVHGALDARRVRAVAARLGTSDARGSLATLTAFHRLVQVDHQRHLAVVESAAPLDPAMRGDLEQQLRRLYGAGIVTSFSENPSLLGGLRIKVASDVYDGSIRARLAALQARL